MKLKALRLFLTACVFFVCALAGHGARSCPTGEVVLKQIPLGTDPVTGKSIDSMYHPGVSYVFPSRSLLEEAVDNTVLVGGEEAVQRVLDKSYALKPGTCIKILSADSAASIGKVRITSGSLSGKTGYIDLLWSHDSKPSKAEHRVRTGEARNPTIDEFVGATRPDCYDFFDACYHPGFDGPDPDACAQYEARCR